MAIEIRQFSVTIPPGTAKTAGFTSSLAIPARVVTEIRVRIPPGPRGEVGFGIGSSGIIIVPYGNAGYIITDDEDLDFPLEQTIESGAWQLFGYNTGLYPHTLQVYLFCEVVSSGPPTDTTILPITPGSGTTTSGDGAGTGSTGTGTGGTGSAGGGSLPSPPPLTPPPPLSPPPTDGGGGTGGGTLPAAPIILPPTIPGPPGSGPIATIDPGAPILVQVSGSGVVYLVDEDHGITVPDQDTATALLTAGLPVATVSAAMGAVLGSAAGASVQLSLGDQVITGTWSW